MVVVKSLNQLILNAIDFYRGVQPQLDTKPGTVARDILIDGPSTQLSRLYEELARIRNAQSLRLSIGIDLVRLAQNFGATKNQGSKSQGIALYTFNAIDSDIPINQGDIITANNGATFTVINSQTITATLANTYRATASMFSSNLDFIGITDQYAIQVAVQATAVGAIGNISTYALSTTSTPGISNVTNTSAFIGGSDVEDDAAFKTRVLGIFSGANTGTTLGYRNAALTNSAVLDAIVIGPGDPLMTRDGTQTTTAADGTITIVSEGTGGKVDIYIFGTALTQILDSFVYQDKSNKGDPTDPKNDFVLGQISADSGKTVSRKRIDDIANGVFPNQPINNIISVSGSSSGGNFIQQQTDSLGRITGNYEFIRDTGAYAGSPWGFDKLHFISNKISGFTEGLTKGKFNGQDPVSFTDVIAISAVQQNISITNENSTVSTSDRTSIQLAHKPVSSITRVLNFTTGERYVIANQNPDVTGSINTTGRIVISGNTLPAISDILQVDYTWVYNYDPNFDFDNKTNDNNPRTSTDSVDWGFSNAVRREQSIVSLNGSQLTANVTHPISAVLTVNTFVSETSTITLVSGRLAAIVLNPVSSVISIVRDSDLVDIYNTGNENGTFSGFTIFLPTNTLGIVGDVVNVVYNKNDTFTVGGLSGSFDGYTITLSTGAAVSAGTIVECNYIANIRTLLPSTQLSALPAIINGNSFNTLVSTAIGCQPYTNIYSAPDVVHQNLRQAPSKLQLAISGTISNGVITISGTTFTGVFSTIITATANSLKQNLSSAIKQVLGLSSIQTVPGNVQVIRISSVEKVSTTTNLDVLSVINTYDINGYRLKNNSFVKSESAIDSTLANTDFVLSATYNNNSNIPNIGDRLRITFYFATTNDSENVSFSKSGSLYTQKTFAYIDTVAISSGFTSTSSQTASITISNQNQPASGTRYTPSYDYTAPKSNERISINYNCNQLIATTTQTIEGIRPITSDVLVKAAVPILIDATVAIVVLPSFVSQGASSIVSQNVSDAVSASLNAQALGTTINSSNLINTAYTVQGVGRVRITYFNKTGIAGSVLTITANNNQYLQANNVSVVIETA